MRACDVCRRWMWLGVVLSVWLAPRPGFAGQLHVQDLLLGQVDFAMLVKVVAVGAGLRTVTGTIARCFRKRSTASPACVVGETRAFPIYKGVVWDNPNKSPIDVRYWDRTNKVDAGAQLILIGANDPDGFEPVPYSVERVRKLELFFGDVAPEVYFTKIDQKELVQALGDRDLLDLAARELVRRGAVDAELILSLADRPTFALLLRKIWSALGEPQKTKYLRDLVARATVLSHADTRHEVAHWLTYYSDRVDEAAPLFESFRPEIGREFDDAYNFRTAMSSLLDDRKQRSKAPVFQKFYLKWLASRRLKGIDDFYLATYLELLPAAPRRTMCQGAIDLLVTSAKDRFDDQVFGRLTTFLATHPDPALHHALLGIPLPDSNGPDRGVFETILATAIASGAKDSESRRELRAYYEKYTQAPHSFWLDDEVLAKYRKHMGLPAAKPEK